MAVIDDLKAKLIRELDATLVEIVDESHLHAGHRSAPKGMEATHLKMTVHSSKFKGLNLLDQHRLVYDALKEAKETHLHALQLTTKVSE